MKPSLSYAHVQKQDREEAARSINYLKVKIEETNIADMQSVFIS